MKTCFSNPDYAKKKCRKYRGSLLACHSPSSKDKDEKNKKSVQDSDKDKDKTFKIKLNMEEKGDGNI